MLVGCRCPACYCSLNPALTFKRAFSTAQAFGLGREVCIYERLGSVALPSSACTSVCVCACVRVCVCARAWAFG